jgi:hypothetical protein
MMVFVLGILVIAVRAGAADPTVKCESQKLKAAGKYGQCRMTTESSAVSKGVTADFEKCDHKFSSKWQKIEETGSEACPTLGDELTVRGEMTDCTDRLATRLSGDPVPPSCGSGGDRVLATGQTTSYGADKNDGIAGEVPVPDDGAFRKGLPQSFTDNGNGTITDNNTGLMWEKKDYETELHVFRRTYRWSGDGTQETIWDWLDDVNAEGGTGFAGYNDWRIPNVTELLSIMNYGARQAQPVFNNNCTYPCSVTTCSCSAAETSYWSSTTAAGLATYAWIVQVGGAVGIDVKNNPNPYAERDLELYVVRAVRGGL